MSPTWTCTACAVSVRYAPGRLTPSIPAGWERHEEGYRCLGCARERAVAIALREAEIEGDTRGELTIEREALARFEVRRDPDRSNAEIGRAINTTAGVVASARRALVAVTDGAGGGS